ncbi:MAG: thiamine-phosphate kinase [Rhodanobacteraceae bacterium]
MSEFNLIEIIRARTAQSRGDVVLGIGDDAALLKPPAGQQLVACTDTLVAGVHFPQGTAPQDIGWKSLAVNLSDLAAMGATPAWAMLALTLPKADRRFVETFADGFAQLARAHAVNLVGGDTTQGPLSVTVSAFGFSPESRALLRSGARVGDAVFVTGTLGDAAAALRLKQDSGLGTRDPSNEQARSELLLRLNRPEPRIAAGLALRDVASACIDVSDGLLADLGHICEASGMGAVVEADALPLSSAMLALFDADERRAFALSGGDDYELCFTASVDRADRIAADFARLGFGAARIGRIVAEAGVRVRDANGNAVEPPRRGWQHFAP